MREGWDTDGEHLRRWRTLGALKNDIIIIIIIIIINVLMKVTPNVIRCRCTSVVDANRQYESQS